MSNVQAEAAEALIEMGATEEQIVALIGVCPKCKQETDEPHECGGVNE